MLRTIVEEAIVSETIDQSAETYPRLEEAFDGLKWFLAHSAESGEILDDFHWIFRNQADHDQNIPAILVVYTFDENKVTLKFIALRMPLVE
ncbi:MAG: hypothetical protein WCF30_13560 [Terracidiphilus sp.]